MKTVIPLAGPDFEGPDDAVKAEILVGGEPLLLRTLTKRSWWRRGQSGPSDLVFVLRDTLRSRSFARERLIAWFPDAHVVHLSNGTQGAAMTVLAGLAPIAHAKEPLCLDLVDIDYETDFDPVAAFADPSVGAAALVFTSSNPIYSYLKTNTLGEVVEAAEKRVISDHASVGTYFFASPADYLSALADNLLHRERVMHNGLFFVCPVFNGILAAGKRVIMEKVSCVHDVKVA